MQKLMGPLILVVMAVLCVASWTNILSIRGKDEAAYSACIERAEKLESKKIYIEAIDAYREAQEMQPDNIQLAYNIAHLYDLLGEEENYIMALCEVYAMNPSDFESCTIILESLINKKDYDVAYSYVQKALAQEECAGEWKETFDSYSLTLRSITKSEHYMMFDSIGEYAYPLDTAPSAVVNVGGAYGVVDLEGAYILKPDYDEVGHFGNGYIPVKENGEYFYVDTSNYRRRVPDFEVEWIGSFSEGYAPFIHGGEYKGLYGYLDTDMNSYAIAFKNAGVFFNGYAAVQEQDGGWLLIDNGFRPAFDVRFDEIYMDENGYASHYGVFWGKKDGLYYLCDIEGNIISDGYTEVKPFASREPCAVKTANGLWGFVDIEGNLVKDGMYLDAKSYSCGYAPVVENNDINREEPSWILVDSESNPIYTAEFMDDISVVSYAGSFVAKRDDTIINIWMHLYK